LATGHYNTENTNNKSPIHLNAGVVRFRINRVNGLEINKRDSEALSPEMLMKQTNNN